MSEPRLSILLATVDPSLAWLTQQALDRLSGVDTALLECDSVDAAVERTRGGGIDIVILEHALLDGEPVAALSRLREVAAEIPLLIAGGEVEPLLEGWFRDDRRADQLTADELSPRTVSRFLAAAVRAGTRTGSGDTTRQVLETTLRGLRERYRTLLSQSPAATWEADFSGIARFIEGRRREGITDLKSWFDDYPETVPICAEEARWLAANDEAAALGGTASAEELVESPGPFGPFADAMTFATVVCRLAAGETSFDLETTQRTSAGETLPVRLRLTAASGYHGSLGRVFVTITDRRPELKLDERARDAEARTAQATAEAAEAASKVAGAEIRLAELEEQLRRTEEELHRTQLRLHETRQEADRAGQQLEEVEQALELSTRRLEEAERRGDERLAEATSLLKSTTAAYQALVRSIPIPVIVCDSEGQVSAWNAGAEKLFGWSAEQAIGGLNPTVAADQREEYRRTLRARIAAGETRELEAFGRLTSKGTALDLKLSCVPLVGPEGEALGEVCSVLAARPARPVAVSV